MTRCFERIEQILQRADVLGQLNRLTFDQTPLRCLWFGIENLLCIAKEDVDDTKKFVVAPARTPLAIRCIKTDVGQYRGVGDQDALVIACQIGVEHAVESPLHWTEFLFFNDQRSFAVDLQHREASEGAERFHPATMLYRPTGDLLDDLSGPLRPIGGNGLVDGTLINGCRHGDVCRGGGILGQQFDRGGAQRHDQTQKQQGCSGGLHGVFFPVILACRLE